MILPSAVMYVLDRLRPAISALTQSRNLPHDYLADARSIHSFRTEHARRNGSYRLRAQTCAFDTLALIHPEDKQYAGLQNISRARLIIYFLFFLVFRPH